jgi:hypothetical protein
LALESALESALAGWLLGLGALESAALELALEQA